MSLPIPKMITAIAAFSGKPARAVHQTTSKIPIVMDADDPVGIGLVASLHGLAGTSPVNR